VSGAARTVLLTGFEPFDGQAVNASWLAVQEVRDGWDRPERLITASLPVSFRGARQALRTQVAEHAPDVVVCVGEAGRAAVSIERVAVNLIDARIPDNDGSAPVDVPVVAGAPTAFLSGLPVKACLLAAQRTGVPVEVSGTAGSYVCNATFYALMHLLARQADVAGGFVHVPRVPEQVGAGEPSLPAAETSRALRAILDATLDGSGQHAGEAPVSAGRED
jgi:pyroglutamyl-peptidase